MDSNNTIDEIKAYLDDHQIAYNLSATKSDLLALIPAEETTAETTAETTTEAETTAETTAEAETVPEAEAVPEQQPVVPAHREPYYTKAELLGLITGYMHDYFFIALKNGRTYTYKEALQAVDDWKHSGTIF